MDQPIIMNLWTQIDRRVLKTLVKKISPLSNKLTSKMFDEKKHID